MTDNELKEFILNVIRDELTIEVATKSQSYSENTITMIKLKLGDDIICTEYLDI